MSRFLFLLLPFMLLFYVAIIYTSEPMLLLLFSLVILCVCSFFYLCVAFFGISGKVVAPISVTDAGNPVTVQVKIRNKCFLPVFYLHLKLEVGNSFERKKTSSIQKISQVLPGENQVDFSLLLERPGIYEIYLRSIQIYDPLGFCFLKKRCPAREIIQVMPELSEVPVALTHPVKNFFGDSDIYDEERGGHDNSETFQIRSYAVGDRLQSIHWKLSAKAGELMVKESSLPKACPVVFLLDYGGDKAKGHHDFGSFLEVAASLSFSMMDAGCPHYVAWHEESIKDLRRLRVDDEESFYVFLSDYLKEQGKGERKRIKSLYDEKYRAERYLHFLCLTEKLELYQDERLVCKFRQDRLRQQLGGVEIVL